MKSASIILDIIISIFVVAVIAVEVSVHILYVDIHLDY